MVDDQMRYDEMAREALRGVVRQALSRVAQRGLPGKHHFYISFRTRAPGVDLDPELLAKHPSEMTIVLERRFWDLAVDEEAFEVTLTFNRVPKYLRVPFAAVTQFHDPSVGFTLRFDAPAPDAARRPPQPQSAKSAPRLAPKAAPPKAAAPKGPSPKVEGKPAAPASERPKEPRPAGSGGEVVSIDAFRKKPE